MRKFVKVMAAIFSCQSEQNKDLYFVDISGLLLDIVFFYEQPSAKQVWHFFAQPWIK